MAGILENPPVLQQPFAYNGDKNTIPLNATGDQRASLQEGFPPITSVKITEGGIPPERKDFNGLGNLLSSLYFYLQNGGRFTFNQDVSDAIGGYPQNATLWYNDSSLGINYPVTSLINNNTYNFVTTPSYIDGVKWKRIIDSFPSTQITNCITEIPQDIKLELNNGTLTLKAGSKVYDGAGNVINITSDIKRTDASIWSSISKALILCTSSDLDVVRVERAFSGSTPPESPNQYDTWYDTTNKVIKRYLDGVWTGNWSLSLGIFNGPNMSIDQVFNGFGYIGSTVFALPGVKGLIPNGRNADGSLKNTELNSGVVKTYTESSTGNRFLMLDSGGVSNFVTVLYDEEKNILYNSQNKIISRLVCGTFTREANGVITSFTPKNTFQAVDRNELKSDTLKRIAYEKVKFYTANGTLNIPLQDTDEIINVTINGNSTLNFDVSQLNFPAQNFYTVQIKLFPGTFTISLNVIGLQENAPIVWVNGNVADLSGHKPHWVVLRTYQDKGYALWSDAGTEG